MPPRFDAPFTVIVRPSRSKVLIGNDFVFEAEDGDRLGELRLRLLHPNVYRSAQGDVALSHAGFAHPRFQARRADGSLVASVDYSFLTGAFTLHREGEPPLRIDEEGMLLPVLRVVEPDGTVPLRLEAWRLFGKEWRIRVAPTPTSSTEDLLALAALVLHAETSLKILFGAAASAGALTLGGRRGRTSLAKRMKAWRS